MRTYGMALASVLLGAAAAPAQQPPAAPGQLDAVLQRWEHEMKNVQSLVAQFTRTTVDKTYGTNDHHVGSAKFLKPNLATMEMYRLGKDKKPEAQASERFVCTGDLLYIYSPAAKEVRIYELGPQQGNQIGDDSFLGFLFGMKADEAKRRYDMELVKEDQYYYYLKIIPKMPADKADFQQARLVLLKSTCMPRQVWWEQPTGNEINFDIGQVQTNLQLTKNHFNPPAPPAGWTPVRVPRPQAGAPGSNPMPPPRVVRPNQ